MRTQQATRATMTIEEVATVVGIARSTTRGIERDQPPFVGHPLRQMLSHVALPEQAWPLRRSVFTTHLGWR
jgi:hypothetical protein